MNVFPTQYSVLSATALNNYLSEAYDLDNTACCLLIHNVSDTYLLENGDGKYIFKIYRDAHRKPDEIKGEINLLLTLKGRGAKVSYPLADLTGKYFHPFNAAEGIRYGVLFTYAKGKVSVELSETQLEELGKEMAVLHNITSDTPLVYNRIRFDIDTTITLPLQVIKPAFAELRDEYDYLITTAAKVTAKLQETNYSNFSYGYCQYDFLPKNFHFDDDDNITFFDFDFAGEGYLMNDIMSFYIHYFLEVTYGKMSRSDAEAAFGVFLNSYRKVRQLHEDELKAMCYLGFGFWIFYLGFQYENFDDWSNIFFGPKFLKDRVALIKKWIDWFGEL
ncbi:MAG TPA: phosphotransferase [Mucilaginibacter sp.]